MRTPRGEALILLSLVAATRLPLVGRSLGEPDAARYAVGLLQWLRGGSGAHFIYGKLLSPGYYAAAAAVVRMTSLAPLRVLEMVSVAAALATAPVAWAVGSELTSPEAAFWGSALFLLTPAVWWLGIEPHPQGTALLCVLMAMGARLKWRGAGGWAAATAALTAGLLAKSDFILLAGIFPALECSRRAGRGRILAACAIPAGALGLCEAGRDLILGIGWRAAQAGTAGTIRQFLALPQGREWIKQLLPIVAGPGMGVWAIIVLGLWLGWERGGARWRRRWGWPLAAWCVPLLGFWMLIRGNDARHMAALALLPLWAAMDAIVPALRTQAAARRKVAIAAAAAMLAACAMAMPPASSNTTLFPSGDVPGSVADLADLNREMSRQVDAGSQGTRCWLGNSTLPYLELELLRRQSGILQRLDGFDTVYAARFGSERFVQADTTAEAIAIAQRCEQAPHSTARSLEFDAAGERVRFFGSEWKHLPLARRWYRASFHADAR